MTEPVAYFLFFLAGCVGSGFVGYMLHPPCPLYPYDPGPPGLPVEEVNYAELVPITKHKRAA